MKKNRKLVLLIAFISLGFTSCSDFLSELPDNRTVIDSEEKISELLVAAYPDGSYFQIAEMRSDNFDDKGNVSASENLALSLYSWEVPVSEDQDSPIFYWNACYKAIAQANQALASIEELATEENPMGAQRGEALVARAYAHFMLVNLWAEHYDPATASSQLGIPYVTKPETELLVDYSRSTVQENYDQIESDLLEGLELLRDNDYEAPRFHFTREATLAFATRFYLYKGEWQNVINNANDLLTSNLNRRPWEQWFTLQYSEIEAIFSNSSQPTNLLLSYTSSVYSRTFASSRFGLSEAKRSQLFSGATNPTGQPWIFNNNVYGRDFSYNFPKFQEYFEYTNINAGIGFVHTPNVLFNYDEILLARAEAYAMIGDFENSLIDINNIYETTIRNYNPSINSLTKNNILAYYPIVDNEYNPYYELTPDQESFIKCIAEIRRRDFYFEGLRWFDNKRFHMEVVHEFENRQSDTLRAYDNRRLLQIPQDAIANGIQPNPR